MSDCIFCKNLPKVLENDLAYAVYDIKPHSKGHMLVIPKRHHMDIFASSSDEIKAVFDLVTKVKQHLDKEHHPDGYNLVANCGAVAGQIVMHTHLHVIPRYSDQPFRAVEGTHA